MVSVLGGIGWRRWLASLTVLSLATAGLVAVGVTGVPAEAASTLGCVDTAPSESEAVALAVSCQRQVVVGPSITERSQIVATVEGALILQAAVAPQRVRGAGGIWRPISTDLVQRSDGSVGPAATLADVRFSGGGSGPLVTWREAGATFTLSWPLGSLPAPRLNGATATYESVLDDVDLHVTATAEGYTQVVEILTPAAAGSPAMRSLRYLTGGDMRVEQNGAGEVRLVDAAGRAVATSAPAMMWDSSDDPARGGEVVPAVATARAGGGSGALGEPATAVEPAATSRSAPVSVAVSDGGLTVTPDPVLMADPGLTYPVFVDPAFEKLRRKWAYASSNGESNETSRARVGRQPEPEGGSGERYRSFYDFDVAKLRGKRILSGVVRIELDHSWSCSPTWVHLYRTGSITVGGGKRMAWSTRPLPAAWLDSWEGHANEAGGCGRIQPDVDAEFTGSSLRADLQHAADSRWSTYTVGLCACNESGEYESTQDRWKKFYTNRAWLEVTYNSVPGVPSNLTASGQSCGGVVGTASPVLRAYYADADAAGDSLTGYFEYRQLPSGSVVAKTGQVKPGNHYGESGTIALGTGPDGRSYQWRLRTRDAVGSYSPWTPWCGFTLDTARPPKPGVSSSTHPGDGLAHGGPGVSGSFTFTAGAADVVKYVYGWAGQVEPLITVTVSAGASYTVSLTPPRYGYNVLNVYSVDRANKRSETGAHRFLTGAPSAPRAHWPLDSIDSHQFGDQIGSADLVIENSDITWTPDTWVLGERTPIFDSDAAGMSGSATATGTGLDTSGSFSVAAWVRIPSGALCPPEVNRTAVSIDGAQVSGFTLTHNCTQRRWRMRIPATDTASPAFLDAWAPVSLPADTWVHLAGVWDEAEQRVKLWVNGTLDPTSVTTAPAAWASARGSGWKATGPVVVGRDRWNGAMGGPFVGQVRDLRVWNRVVTEDDIRGTDANAAAGTQPKAGLLAPTEVAAWDFGGGLDSGCAPSMSATYWSQTLALHGCTDPSSEPQTVGYTGDAYDDNDALWLNHAQPDGYGRAGQGYAAASGPIVRTDQSVTVSAWVRLAGLSGGEQILLRQNGLSAYSAMRLYVLPSGKWQFGVASPNGTGGTRWALSWSDAPATPNEWVHLVGVFDAVTGTARLYLDGVRQAGTGTGSGGAADPGPLYVGSSDGFSGHLYGTVDQLRLFAGAMSEREITALHRS
ncbi:LamG-like jellyroll fold domain-containing protein [Plantactinospora sp. KLBMP9567]|uniref:LamG-like jellyroll fold domain-containing protein n=1 Tax=Plantactinospora sp. KLBMP9567 TaxID=3085900 RepID=UPI002982AB47|nr:LamG-like jellyroll fold domain-containing protein [Plantactinospora sp. KLBMP9567]MDW5328922.1 LamG-like jellyroll fold domain-containing protein [Plantactinospora sp. KLBMP9567]MDW5328929.1 LamG-like jellyroll fold domain-containing protein [Plantactinospora sp. KLBMP9567]